MDAVGRSYFGDCIGVQVVGSEGQVFSEGDFEFVSALLQGEVLIADSRGASGWVDRQRDEGEVKILVGLIRYLDSAFDPAAIDLGFSAPFHNQGRDHVE